MSKIDTQHWKDFKIIDLFTVANTHSILKISINENSGSTPYVTASNENNGVFSYIDYDKSQIEKGNAIMIGGKTLTVTYQKQDFFSNDSHNLVLHLKEEAHSTEKVLLFMISALKASIGNIYSWGDSISYKTIQKDIIWLPVDSNGNPDFAYMESYMRNLETTVSASLTKLQLALR